MISVVCQCHLGFFFISLSFFAFFFVLFFLEEKFVAMYFCQYPFPMA